MPMGDMYIQMENYLKHLSLDETRMTFKEIESIIGFELKPSARKYKEWWSNTYSHSQAYAWLNAGYKTSLVDMKNELIIFKKENL